MSDHETDLGTCCICGGTANVRSIVMLQVKNIVRGHGWGCVVCGLPMDGASAVLCATCTPAWAAGEPLRFACRGYPGTDGRVSLEALTEPHEHDMSFEH